MKLSAPAAARNREPIAAVLADELPPSGLVLEVASGTGEHALHFAHAFPALQWQPSDPDPQARDSIAAWRAEAGLANLLPPLDLDAARPDWPIGRADAIVCINMVHISPIAATEGLVEGAALLLAPGAPLILYGPWLEEGVETVASNVEFDRSLKGRSRDWGIRRIEWFDVLASGHGLERTRREAMPANNLMLVYRRR